MSPTAVVVRLYFVCECVKRLCPVCECVSSVNRHQVYQVSFRLRHVLREETNQGVKQFCTLSKVVRRLSWNISSIKYTQGK